MSRVFRKRKRAGATVLRDGDEWYDTIMVVVGLPDNGWIEVDLAAMQGWWLVVAVEFCSCSFEETNFGGRHVTVVTVQL